jgi:Domain of unknown function (DUF4440)
MSDQPSEHRPEQAALAADSQFFSALVDGDGPALDGVLADGFVLVDVNTGSTVPREVLVPLVGEGQLKFDSIEPDPSDVLVRRYGTTVIVVGRTQMHGSYAGTSFSARSRYTHVFVEDHDHWRLASAQGTPITGD